MSIHSSNNRFLKKSQIISQTNIQNIVDKVNDARTF